MQSVGFSLLSAEASLSGRDVQLICHADQLTQSGALTKLCGNEFQVNVETSTCTIRKIYSLNHVIQPVQGAKQSIRPTQAERQQIVMHKMIHMHTYTCRPSHATQAKQTAAVERRGAKIKGRGAVHLHNVQQGSLINFLLL